MPNRIIKESICTSDTIDQLSWFEEVFFYRLIVNCDDYGRFDARPAILKARLFPLKSVTEKQIIDALNKLSTVGIVALYEYDGKPYLQLVTWDKHQTVRNKKSKYPAVDGSEEASASENVKLISSEYNCNQLNSNASLIQSNTNTNPNTNPNTNTNTNTETRAKKEKPQSEKVQFAENVSMTNAEYEKLVSTYGEANTLRMIEKLDNYKGATGKKYKSDYRAILNWVADEIIKQKNNKDSQEPKSWGTLRYLYQKFEQEEAAESEKNRNGATVGCD